MKKKTPGDIIILHYTINNNHMMYGSWDIQARQTEFFVILDHFLPFYPYNNPKTQNFQKLKKKQEISSFYTNVPKIMIISQSGISHIGRILQLQDIKIWQNAIVRYWQKVTAFAVYNIYLQSQQVREASICISQ